MVSIFDSKNVHKLFPVKVFLSKTFSSGNKEGGNSHLLLQIFSVFTPRWPIPKGNEPSFLEILCALLRRLFAQNCALCIYLQIVIAVILTGNLYFVLDGSVRILKPLNISWLNHITRICCKYRINDRLR